MNSPLENILILDLTRLLPGPFATQILADLGARVIRIESPNVELTRLTPPFLNNESGLFLAINRNKESISLNLKKNSHKKILIGLIKKADVFLEGFRPGVMERLGFSSEAVLQINPKIIYCSLSGFGSNSKMKSKAAHDLNYYGLAGLLSDIPLFSDKVNYPPITLPNVPIADLAGALYGVIGILSALFARTISNKGCYVDTSLFDGVFHFINGFAGAVPIMNSNNKNGEDLIEEKEIFSTYMLSGHYPYYTIYQTLDKKWLSLGALEPEFWREFCLTIDLPDLVEQQHQFSSKDDMEKVYWIVQEKIGSKSLDQWMSKFRDVNTCLHPIKTLSELKTDSILFERERLIKIPHPDGGTYFAPNLPIKFSQWKLNQDPKKPPETGENGLEIMKEFNLDPDLLKED